MEQVFYNNDIAESEQEENKSRNTPSVLKKPIFDTRKFYYYFTEVQRK